MTTETELFKAGKHSELWQRCCGFIDLGISDFMRIQDRLLMEQLELLRKCELGRYILNGVMLTSRDDFRNNVPLTTYEDYAPYLIEKREDTLPDKPALWQYTSGKSGEYPFRWAPVTNAQLKEIRSLLLALVFFCGCRQRNEIVFSEGDKALYGMAPPPYATGTMARVFPYDILEFMPPVDEAEKESFEQRIGRGFELALSEGLDVFLAMSSVAVAIGERFSQKSNNTEIRSILKKPKAALRLAKGIVKSRLAHRPLLPKDIWSPKGIITFGIDSSIYKHKIRDMWGVEPLEFHGCTEAVVIAMQLWDHQGMTFIPNLNYFEFIPEEESIKSRENPAYQPSTVLLDEVKPGNYELVITSLHGGPFVRYRLGHLIEITSLRNEELNINIPQMQFLSRVDDQIDIAGFTRLSEKIIWQAIENAGLTYSNWTVRKEINNKPVLHLYIELKDAEDGITEEQVANRVHNALKKLDTPYAELEDFTGLRPLEVTILPENSFHIYKLKQQHAGSDLTQLSPPHINPSSGTVEFLVNASLH
jgi:hypothetical protein